MFCRWVCQPPPCLCALLSPVLLYQQTRKQKSVLWTHYSVWSSYHNQPFRASKLESDKLCSLCSEGWFSSQSRRKETERGRGGREDHLYTFAHLSLGISTQSEIRRLCGRVSILGMQWWTHKGFISSDLLSPAFRRIPSLPLFSANITVPHKYRHMLPLQIARLGGGRVKNRISPITNASVKVFFTTVGNSPRCLIVIEHDWWTEVASPSIQGDKT